MTRILIIIAGAFAVAATAQADVFNHRNLLPGERAALLGGAYTALSEDLSGALYNPAGLAFVRRRSFALATTAYQLARFERVTYLGPQEHALGAEMNRLHIIPSTLGVSLPLGDRVTLGLAVFEVDRLKLSSLSVRHGLSFTEEIGGEVFPVNDVVFRIDLDTSSIVAGPSVAVQATDRLAIGVSLFYHLAQQKMTITEDAVSDTGIHGIVLSENQVLSGGLTAVIGAKWYVTPRWQLGLSYGSETIHTNGTNTYAFSVITNSGFSVAQSGTSRGDARLPHRLSLGLAYERPGAFTLAADAVCYLPLDFSAPHEILHTQDPENHHREVLHADFSLGSEIFVRQHWAVRMGLFTNTSGAHAQDRTERVHSFGGATGIAFVDGGESTAAGLSFQYGSSDRTQLPSGGTPVSWTRWQLQVLLGGTLELFTPK